MSARPHPLRPAAALLLALTLSACGDGNWWGADSTLICRVETLTTCPGANLGGRDLTGQFMSMMNLAGADLSGTKLRRANLSKTKLTGANLERADLADAFLTGADLTGANLAGADLRRAFLFGAFIDRADLAGARLAGARWIDGGLCGPESVGQCQVLPFNAEVAAPMRDGPPGGAYSGAVPSVKIYE